jgi:acylphosphatase
MGSADERAVRRTVAHFAGRVQGVGFRYTCQHLASGRDVRGYVRNLPDGRVELVVEGTAGEIDGLIEAIRGRMADFIRAVDLQNLPASGEFDGFEIRG